jgi:N6-L-threonylcarbamoyladenine synthase
MCTQQAHALVPILTADSLDSQPCFPFLTLLVSGGHTLLALATSPTAFRTLATTRDESVGRAFDKVARLLSLEWAASLGPGAALERFCAESDDDDSHTESGDGWIESPLPVLPRVLRGELTFSYSGLHSIIERYVSGWRQRRVTESETIMPVRTRRALARAFQTAAVAQLEEKVLLALDLCARERIAVRHVVVSGGVASNHFLRQRLVHVLRACRCRALYPDCLFFEWHTLNAGYIKLCVARQTHKLRPSRYSFLQWSFAHARLCASLDYEYSSSIFRNR